MPTDAPQPGVDYPRSFHELTSWFGDDEACLRYLERVRWGDGFVCRFCGAVGGEWWAVRRGPRRCAACRHEASVTAGTIWTCLGSAETGFCGLLFSRDQDF